MSDGDLKSTIKDARKAYRSAKRIKSLVRKGKREAESLKKTLGKDGEERWKQSGSLGMSSGWAQWKSRGFPDST